MRTIPTLTAHKELTRNHNTMKWETEQGRLSVRKTHGEYVVRLFDAEYDKVTITKYKTLNGALIAAENLREYYL